MEGVMYVYMESVFETGGKR